MTHLKVEAEIRTAMDKVMWEEDEDEDVENDDDILEDEEME